MNRVNIGDEKVFSIADLEREGTARMVSHIAQYYNEGAMDLATCVTLYPSCHKPCVIADDSQAEGEHSSVQSDQA